MMAKMFYTMEETQSALGRNEEEIKQLVREGRLREFRDGPRLMFKADQVEQLKGAGDQISLGPSDTGAPLGLAESKGASGSGITLSDEGAAASGGGPSPALGPDVQPSSGGLGLSGSLGGVPSPAARGSGSGTGLSGTGPGRAGINVFGADEVDHVDPSAQTAISSGSGLQDQVNLEGVGSGSGLLDLTRESDDTSLGPETLDEITPGTIRPPASADTSAAGVGIILEEPQGGVTRGAMTPVVYKEADDPMAAAFGAASLGAAAVVIFGVFVLISAVIGTMPEVVQNLGKQSIWVLTVGGVGAAVIFFFVGMIIGKAASR